MKTTLKQLEAACTHLNTGLLRESWFGVFAERVDQFSLRVRLQARKTDKASNNGTIFAGTAKECAAFLEGIRLCMLFRGGVDDVESN